MDTDLPSTRELELEQLIRHRDAQLAEVNDEVLRLRRYLADQPAPSATDLVTLPPPLMSILLPHIASAAKGSTPSSSTVVTALTQRARLLQEENDELYEVLKVKETGKLKEEVRGLRRVVQRLEGALRESHSVINALTTELDKTYEALMMSSKQIGSAPPSTKNTSRSPRNSYHTPGPSQSSGMGNGSSRLPPTGPRAFKKPRLSDPRSSPPPRSNQPPLPASHRQQQQQQQQQPPMGASHPSSNSRGTNARDYSRPPSDRGGAGKPSAAPPRSKMEVDEERETLSPVTDRDRERPREREYDGSKGRNLEREQRGVKDRDRAERGRDRDRDGNRTSLGAPRRNGNFQGNSSSGRGGGPPGGGAGGGPGHNRRINHNSSDRNPGGLPSSNSHAGIDRTLAERLGL